jgi:hypothetical protein
LKARVVSAAGEQMANERSASEGLEREEQPIASPTDQFTCELCGATFISKKAFQEHQQHYKDKRPSEERNEQGHEDNYNLDEFACEFCNGKFSSSEELRTHRNRCSVRQRAEGG